ncbi:MAG: hypothetical protein A2157_20095 [Deltaproteobacteria bacterium RBG_16_47_11]|nr:MAG: hypothetical protein A2157_20095 [Deltaproteobacteria bacterium RBG_16_47_11]
MKYFISFVMVLFIMSGNVSAKDAWDADGSGDNTAATTQNVLIHTAPAQTHDLEDLSGPVTDQDWYVILQRAYRSYEVQVFDVTDLTLFNDPQNPPVVNALTRRDAAGNTVVQDSAPLDPSGRTRTLRWYSNVDIERRILVSNGFTGNTANTRYSIKLYDTTLFCPRWNNAGTQVSVLIVQATDPMVSSSSCHIEAYFYDESGLNVGTATADLGLHGMWVYPVSSNPSLAGKKGSAQMIHTCGYGGLAAKLVALEPSTGFSFDTPCTYLPR